MSNERIGEAMAREQVRAINGFYNHFVVFATVMAVLAAINGATGDSFWVHWVLIGWGLGIGLHAYLVFVRKPQRDAEAKARLTRPGAAPTV
jgi:hypothetical protein